MLIFNKYNTESTEQKNQKSTEHQDLSWLYYPFHDDLQKVTK